VPNAAPAVLLEETRGSNASDVIDPGFPVALKVATSDWFEVTFAVAVLVPAVVPKVQVLVAIPLPMVLVLALVRDPPP
jgi:hypothetical protein